MLGCLLVKQTRKLLLSHFFYYSPVMRLTRPTLASPVVVTCDSTDLPGNTLNVELKNDCTTLQGMETVAVGQFMILPQSFG